MMDDKPEPDSQIQSIVGDLSDVSCTALIVEDLDRQAEIVEVMRHEYVVAHKEDPLQKLCKHSFAMFNNLHDLAQAFYGISLIVHSIRDCDLQQDPDNIVSDALDSLVFSSDSYTLLSLQEYMVESVSVIDRLYLLKGEILPALDGKINFFKRMAGDTFFTAENYTSLIDDDELKSFLERKYGEAQPIGKPQNLFQRRNDN